MPLKIKVSKFRHVFGQSTRKDGCFEGIRITKNAHDSNFCAVNPKFFAVVLESVGGGAFLVLPIKQVGRVDINAPKVCGHAGPITDIKWNPFDDHVIASSSDDMTIKIWEIPELGLHSNLTNCVVELRGHGRRVTYVEWHPSAENILLSCAFDYRCIVWDIAHGQPLNVISCHSNTIHSISWNSDGSLFSTSCKDKKIRVIDPRTGCVLQEGTGHSGLKSCKLIFLNNNRLFTTGFSRSGDREIALWNASDLSAPLNLESIDYSSGVLLPYYDSDIELVYLAGKGDGNVRYFEVVDNTIAYLSQYPSSDPQRGLCQMPKRGVDVSKCEVARFYKLHTNKQLIEPLPMIVPRRSDEFAAHIYPPTLAATPALTAEEWISGVDREPVRVSVKPRRRKPKDDLQAILELADRGSNSEPSRVGSLRAYTKAHQRTQVVKPVQKAKPPPKNAPASLQNIYKLCTDTSKVSLEVKEAQDTRASPESTDHDSSPPASNLLPSQIRQQEQQKHNTPPAATHHSQIQQHGFSKQSHSPQSPYQQSQHSPQQLQQPHRQVTHTQHHVQQSPQFKQQSPQFVPKQSTQQTVKQAHVRPNSQSSSQQYSEEVSRPHHVQSSATCSYRQHEAAHTNHTQPQQHSEPWQHNEPTTTHSSQQNYQHPHPQSLKWKNNLAWQKPAAPVGSTYDRVSPNQYRIIGHHSTSPKQNRQLLAEQTYKQASLDADHYDTAARIEPSPLISPPDSSHPASGSISQHARSKSCPSPNVPSSDVTSHFVRASEEHDASAHKQPLSPAMEKSDASDNKDIPLAYRYTSSTISSRHDTSSPSKGMSEVERKKKMKQMKQKIKRSSSASKVESVKSSMQSVDCAGRKSPPARLQSDSSQSPDMLEEQRKILIAKKVVELKRIRDLARAYAEGELNVVTGHPKHLMTFAEGTSSSTKKPRRQPVTETIEPATHGLPTAAIQPELQSSQKNFVQAGDRFAVPAFVDGRKAKRRSSKDSKHAKHQEQLRSTNVSRYDNASPSELEHLPKFPVDRQADDETLYDNVADVNKKMSTASKVSAPIAPQMKPKQAVNGAHTSTLSNDELHKAYFKQCDENKHLRQQNQVKDKKIDTLEKELAQLKKLIIGL